MISMADNSDTAPSGVGAAPLSRTQEARLDALIGNKLRSYFDELMAEPVPLRIIDLLQELDAKERQGEKHHGEAGPDKTPDKTS
jgi:hypothetical protein